MNNKNAILAFTALTLALSACVQREMTKHVKRVQFQAIQADGPSTKTVLQADGSVFWSPGDAVSLFYGGATIQKTKLTAENTSAAAQTIFSGVLDGFMPDGSTSWAVYPYSAETAFDGSTVTVTVPAEQTAVAGTFASDAFVSMATSKDYTLHFYILCGGIKFSVANQGITSVIFKGNNDEILAGQVQAVFDENGKPVVTEVVKGTMELVLNAPEGGFEVGKWYYIVALPTTLSAGYTMTFLDAAGEVVAERVTDSSIAIKRAVWGKLTEPDDVFSASKYLTFTSEGTTTISLDIGINKIDPIVYYSTDAQNWGLWDYSDLTFSKEEPLYICGDNPDGFNAIRSNSIFNRSFNASGDPFSISGDIMSLIDPDDDVTTIPVAGCFYELFKGCTLLTGAPALPATKLTDACYYGMFEGCTLLSAVPELPALELEYQCYEAMFKGCKGITAAPQLPATTLAGRCYFEMFTNCTSLIDAPGLPATTLADDCYLSMFEGCSSLVTAPELPAMSLADGCYLDMFASCSSLTTAPDLPATTLARYCYQYMFSGCSSLTGAPELPATTLSDACYKNMFSYCTSLTEAPELPASVLTKECYYDMFGACYALNYVKCLATDISAENCLTRWLYNVPSTGTFVRAADMNDWPSGESGIPQGWVVLYDGETSISATKYLTFTSDGTTTISYPGSGSFTPVLYYSFNTTDWTRWDLSELTFSANNPLYLCGDNLGGLGSGDTYYRTLTATGDLFSVSGDIMSLIDRNADHPVAPYYGFVRLFSGCTLLKEAPLLPATKLSGAAYSHMFDGCTNLAIAPELPATTLSWSCYESMFEGCTSLISAPDLPAEKLEMICYMNMYKGCTSLIQAPSLPAMEMEHWCYSSMFEGCTSLATAPELPSTSLDEKCYSGMFAGCTSLTAAPELPATTLAFMCYSSMFRDCTSLILAPELPATTLAYDCYVGMFRGCTSLTTAPELPATTLTDYCYCEMFFGCTSLTVAPELPATTLASSCYRSMFDSCTSLRVAPFLPAITLSDHCYTEMFAHCTNLEDAPALPATSLIFNCYSGMFWDCTGLTTAPELPASIVAGSAYLYMFKDCTSLNYVKCLATDISAYDCVTEWLSGVSSQGTFIKASEMNDWPSGVSGIPEGWTVQDAD